LYFIEKFVKICTAVCGMYLSKKVKRTFVKKLVK
jgi:hypothetical protein